MNQLDIQNREEIKVILRKHFPSLVEPELIDAIAEVSEVRSFEEGDVIMDYGDYIKAIPMLFSGSIKISRQDGQGNEVLLYYLKAGETCAKSLTCCMAETPSEIHAVAEEDCQFLAIPVNHMDEWMQHYQSWKAFTMSVYQHRFDELLATIDSIAFMKMDDRLEKYLQDKFDNLDSDVIHSSHQEIASDLNTSREVISRLLKQMEKDGKVELGRNRIKNLAYA